MDAAHPRPDVEALERDVGRVADRLRSMSDVRLAQPYGRDGTRASAALDLAQLLADAAAGVEARAGAQPPVHRVVPDLGVFALGDQVAVTGQDLLAALTGVTPDEPVWSGGTRVPAGQVLEQAAEAVRALRLTL